MKDIIINGIFCIIETAIIVYFFEASFERKGLKNISSVLPTFLIMLFADIIITFCNLHLFIQLPMFILLSELVLLIFYNGAKTKKLYTVIVTVVLTMAPSLLIIYIVSWTSNVNFATFISQNDTLRIFTNVLIKTFQYIMIRVFLQFQRKEYAPVKNSKTMLTAAIFMFSAVAIINIRNSLLKGNITEIFCVYVTISIIAIDFAYCIVTSTFSEINQKNIDLEMKNRTIKQQQRDIENISKQYYETLKIRHDIRKYLNFAVELTEQKKYDELKEYLSSFQENKLGNAQTYISTENKMFNAIINQKLNEAEQQGITLESCVFDDLNNFNGMDDLELCILFSNLLDNAIEAEKEITNPVIKLTIFKKAGYVCFRIENKVNKDILADNPNLATTKENKDAHGFGLQAVREIIDKHDGIFNATQNKNSFCVEVMLLRNAF